MARSATTIFAPAAVITSPKPMSRFLASSILPNTRYATKTELSIMRKPISALFGLVSRLMNGTPTKWNGRNRCSELTGQRRLLRK